jgi:hypothetical protein
VARHQETQHETDGPQHELALLACVAAVIAWSVGPLFVAGITAPSIAFTPIRLLLSVPVMTLSAYMSGGRLSVDMVKKCFVPGVLFAASMIYPNIFVRLVLLIAVVALIARSVLGDLINKKFKLRKVANEA